MCAMCVLGFSATPCIEMFDGLEEEAVAQSGSEGQKDEKGNLCKTVS